MADSYSIQVIEDIEKFKNLKDEWNILWEKIENPFPYQRWEWVNNWIQYFGKDYRLFVLTARDKGGHLVGIAPLHSKRFGLVKELTFIGQNHGIYLDFLFVKNDEKSIISSFIKHATGVKHSILHLKIPEPSLTIDCINDIFGKDTIQVYTNRYGIEIENSLEDYLKRLGKKTRIDIRSNMRKLTKSNNVEFKVISDSKDIDKALSELYDLNKRKWANNLNATYKDFHRQISKDLAELGMFCIFRLIVNDQLAATVSAEIAKDKIYLSLAGIDYAYSQYSIGKLLYSYCVDWASKSGYKFIDFFSGNQEYKERICTSKSVKKKCVIGSNKNVVIYKAQTTLIEAMQLLMKRLRKLFPK